MTLTVGQIIKWLEDWYPPRNAADWDRVGLVAGERDEPVSRVLLAIDPVQAVADEASNIEAQMVITHHPLFLRGTSSVSADTAKGRLITGLIRRRIALFSAHTNADVAHGGVAEALADLVGIQKQEWLEPLEDTNYGYGRIGILPNSMSLGELATLVAKRLPFGPTGLLVGGDPDRKVRVMAVSGGAGDSFLRVAANHGADVFLTADLRHHPASEYLEDEGPALLCGSHWATEWPWLPVLAHRLRQRAAAEGYALAVHTSSLITEPWALHLPTEGAPQ